MFRILASIFVAASIATLAAQDQQPSVFRSGSDLVRAFVTVIDRDGRLVTTLNKDDFEVRDEGKPQPITLFDNSPVPIRLIVMLDVSGSMEKNLPILRDGTAELVRHLRRDDRARIGTFGDDVVISPTFTREARELVAALPTTIDTNAPTPLWRAIGTAIDSFDAAETEARKVVLVLSDGGDSGPLMRGKFVTQGDVVERARRQEVMVYGVGMRPRGSRQVPGLGVDGLRAALDAGLPDPGLAKVAEETGGGYTEIRVGDNLGLAFAQVAEEIHSQYLLGFVPPKRDGKVHDIDIRMTKGGGLKPRARKNYVAPKS